MQKYVLKPFEAADSPAIMKGYDDPNCRDEDEDPVLETSSDVLDVIIQASPSHVPKPRSVLEVDQDQDGLHSLNIEGCEQNSTSKGSFLLLDSTERLQVSETQFLSRLKCDPEVKVKVVAIIGNTGDGKSFTMNHTFFGGEEVFSTSSNQSSCTMGVWAAYQPSMSTICLDTEGFLGCTRNEDQRKRMLMKILAVSDIIIYRTRSERLHNDMFGFLSDASRAFVKYFSTALLSLKLPGPFQALGPSVIVFHETRNTKVLASSVDMSAEDCLRERLKNFDGFNSIKYVGIQTEKGPTDFSEIRSAVQTQLENTTIRSPRQPKVVYDTLSHLNQIFSGEIKDRPLDQFPEQYFTCGVLCESCGERCERSMGHSLPHRNTSRRCIYRHQFENKVLMCKSCYTNGREAVVTVKTTQTNESAWVGLAKFAWSGSLIECPNCGEIYRSRQYWYGNKSPEDEAVRSEIVHVWKGGSNQANGLKYSAQLVIDGISLISDTVVSVSAQPTKNLKSWVADKVAPAYWKPNSEISNCNCCKIHFERAGLYIHHCRKCGMGVCNTCSKHKMPVPERGWPEETPVRVCDSCWEEKRKTKPEPSPAAVEGANGDTVVYRKYGEAVINTFQSVASILDIPKGYIIDYTRPGYWTPDEEAPNCQLCDLPFGTPEELDKNTLLQSQTSASTPSCGVDRRRHHCRSCGKVVCDSCSSHRRQVPERGWTGLEVRVCDQCVVSVEESATI